MQAAAVAAAVCVVAGLALLPPPAEAHQFKFGDCKKANSTANFDQARFNGTWFAHRKLATSSECLMVNLDWEEENDRFKVQEGRLPIFAAAVPVDIYFNNAGFLSQTDPANPATMKLVWEGFAANMLPYTYTVVDTDYDNYALCVECQSLMGVAKRVSASVLTRSQTPPSEADMNAYLNRLAAEPDVDLKRMSSIQQSTCAAPDDSTYNIRFDNNGVSLMSMSGNEELRNLATINEVEHYVNEVVEIEESQE